MPIESKHFIFASHRWGIPIIKCRTLQTNCILKDSAHSDTLVLYMFVRQISPELSKDGPKETKDAHCKMAPTCLCTRLRQSFPKMVPRKQKMRIVRWHLLRLRKTCNSLNSFEHRSHTYKYSSLEHMLLGLKIFMLTHTLFLWPGPQPVRRACRSACAQYSIFTHGNCTSLQLMQQVQYAELHKFCNACWVRQNVL